MKYLYSLIRLLIFTACDGFLAWWVWQYVAIQDFHAPPISFVHVWMVVYVFHVIVLGGFRTMLAKSKERTH